jgi:hypothetical protein
MVVRSREHCRRSSANGAPLKTVTRSGRLNHLNWLVKEKKFIENGLAVLRKTTSEHQAAAAFAAGCRQSNTA